MDADEETIDFFLSPVPSFQSTRFPGTHARTHALHRVHRSRNNNSGAGFDYSREKMGFFSQKINRALFLFARNEIKQIRSLLSKISFRFFLFFGEKINFREIKIGPTCLWNTVYRRHREPTTRGGTWKAVLPVLQSSNPPALSRVKRYTIQNLLQSSRENPAPVNLAWLL